MKISKKHVKRLLDVSVIEPSSSQCPSPTFLVPKSDHTYRAVIDYRTLDKRIEVTSVPQPGVHWAFYRLSKAKSSTTSALSQAYRQISLQETSKHLTDFLHRLERVLLLEKQRQPRCYAVFLISSFMTRGSNLSLS
jgi:hypothetical protein